MKKLYYKTDKEISYDEFKKDIKYLREKLGVKITSNTLTFKTRPVTMRGIFLGRFLIRYDFNRDRTFFKNCSKNKKHPHSDIGNLNKFSFTCVGQDVNNAFCDGRLLDAYRLLNIMVKNINFKDAQEMSNYYKEDLLEACSDMEICNDCHESLFFNNDCGNPECYSSSLCEDLDD